MSYIKQERNRTTVGYFKLLFCFPLKWMVLLNGFKMWLIHDETDAPEGFELTELRFCCDMERGFHIRAIFPYPEERTVAICIFVFTPFWRLLLKMALWSSNRTPQNTFYHETQMMKFWKGLSLHLIRIELTSSFLESKKMGMIPMKLCMRLPLLEKNCPQFLFE